MPRQNIRVTMNGANPKFELMQSGEKIRDIAPLEIIEAIEAMTTELRASIEAGQCANVDTIEMVMQHTSSLRWL